MSILFLLMPLALCLGLFFLAGFLKSAAQGQYDDLETPAHRMLLDDRRSTSTRPDNPSEVH